MRKNQCKKIVLFLLISITGFSQTTMADETFTNEPSQTVNYQKDTLEISSKKLICTSSSNVKSNEENWGILKDHGKHNSKKVSAHIREARNQKLLIAGISLIIAFSFLILVGSDEKRNRKD
ncbi:hypothetical protein [Lactococcus garvieae]|uniref:hypothetical protein n=1 Tax=Lactococcus garvieae TaxID=1363 RepID=UPI0022DFD655|nr:hypothetical protein [Lactococcus garvieae]